jgi:hypothetical protein
MQGEKHEIPRQPQPRPAVNRSIVKIEADAAASRM